MELYKYISEIISADPIRIVFSNKSNKEYKYNKVKINFAQIKDRNLYQVEKFTDKQVFHENIEKEELASVIEGMMKNFKQMASISAEYNFDMRISKKGKIFFSKHAQTNNIKLKSSHNKKKNYILQEGMIIPPLIDLGVFTKEGKVINSKYDKFKQINRFVEIIDDEIKKIEKDYCEDREKVLHILDFGCGKSYLTFILYYYFTEIKKINVKITGLDLKEDVIKNCNKIAESYGYNNLKFELGDINGYKYENNLDMVITLHACDTATDYALFNAINWNAKMIFSVPCCQHEINSTMKPEKLKLISKYGIIQERVSALFTDSIRANILECMGYKTQLLEFIDIAHSPKNILIRAVKSNVSEAKKKRSLEEIEAMKNEFKFEQTLYSLLRERLEDIKK
ncbi:Methyltransferase domain-containing protein [Peptostreptococcus russellii]|uniref:Methyltransferase domain-containing protein n=1 Tax=Peptostreptococcus russellii TaxID=215200 RepID=A0A1H8GC55_9FIRM|nr:SAM-dependent methyltransferase [Peptostreptococcus russellii]SEN41324.1 Methyltransferase domain-containing protein [Peptostreptococcus russellii]